MKVMLDKGWEMRERTSDAYLEAVVPGSVYLDLMAAGRMGDPFYRDQEKEALEVISHDYEYCVSFDVPDGLLKCPKIMLRFDGIDTLSSISLNGREIGKTDNMHRIWEFPVQEMLKEEGNQLTVTLYSPTEFIEKSYEKEPIEGCMDAMRGLPRLRKAHCMFGWDWGPRIPDAGIFRPVSLIGIEEASIDSVYITQRHEDEAVTLLLDVKTESASDTRTAFPYSVTLISPDGKEQVYSDSPKEIIVNDPVLWWPNGYGSQALYQVRVELLRGQAEGESGSGNSTAEADRVLDVWERRIGLRTMTIRREKDEYGESFAHEVNGVKIFAMGADYIPEDNLIGRVNAAGTRRLLQSARDAHHNVVRVWGGGYYPDDFFYDICDELGLIVWQDFMFACCVYDLTEEFEESITAEFIDNIKRIRHHACLGLWCGNNEMELFLEGNKDGWCRNPIQFSDYIKMFEYIIPKLLKQYDPQTFYWPASPSSGGGFDNPNDENRGDVHYWDVWHGGKPITEYRKFYFRYVSEFGFQSFPSLKTVESFTEPEDRNIFSYVMEKHQRNNSANGRIMSYMEQTYLYPGDFDTILYASQLLQAEAMRYGVEHFRRNRGRCMGCVIWQLNDCWPGASWSMIDYYGRWKAAQYYAKRFFAPIMISCKEEGTLSQDPNVNAQPFHLEKSITLCACNETFEQKQASVTWELRNAGAEVLKSGRSEMTLEPLSSCWLDKVMLEEADIYENYVSYHMEVDGKVCSEGTVLFCAPKFFHFRKPDIQIHVDGDEIMLTADCYAKSIRITNEKEDLLLEDNYFDMNGGSRSIRILKGDTEGLRVKSVYDIR